uniref:UPF0506 domain-containing protein n=1 Tax=Strongyloides venezuelensis TaxID=75913 RepID=A0A0K0FLD3_STRVS
MITLFLLASITIVNSKRYCGSQLKNFVAKTCGFAGEPTPCLKNNAENDLDELCCKNSCTINDVKRECCWTKSCLDRCYPGKKYNSGQVW